MSAPKVCIIGIGAMGADVARRYRDQGHNICVWNRTASKAKVVCDEDFKGSCVMAEKVTDAISLCANGACIIIFLLEQATTDEMLRTEGIGAALADKVFVNLTAGTPDEARETHKLLKCITGNESVKFLDGAISGHNTAARKGEAAVWVSSDKKETFEEVRDCLLEMGRAIFVGPVGASKALNYGVTDLLVHSLFSFFSNAWMLEEEGVDMDIFFKEATKKFEAPPHSFKELLPRMTAMREQGDYTTDPYFTLDVLQTYLKPRKTYEEAHGKPFLFNELCLKMVEDAMGGSPDLPHKAACVTRLQEVMRYSDSSTNLKRRRIT